MKLIFFPIEVYERELRARLKLVERLLDQEKCLIFLIDQDFLFFLGRLRVLPFGAILFKSLQAYMNRWFSSSYIEKSAIFLQDEEGVVTFNGIRCPKTDQQVYFSRNDKRLVEACKGIFCWTKEEYEFYKANGSNNYVWLTGNHRTSKLFKDDLRETFHSEIETLNKDYGKVILFCSTFAQGLGSKGEFAKPKLAAEAEAEKYPAAIKWAYDEWRVHSHLAFFSFLDFVRLFIGSELKEEFKLVFRPHPSESSDFYRYLLQNIDCVELDDRFSIEPWLEKSQIVIGSNCTTLVEAAVYGKPAISFLPRIGSKIDCVLKNLAPARFSLLAHSPEELANHIKKLRSNTNCLSKKIENFHKSARSFVGLPSDWRFIQAREILKYCPDTDFPRAILTITLILLMAVIFYLLGLCGFRKSKGNVSYKSKSKTLILNQWKQSFFSKKYRIMFTFNSCTLVKRC